MKFSKCIHLIDNTHVVVMSGDLATLYEGDKDLAPFWLSGYEIRRIHNYDDFSTVTLDVETYEMWTPEDTDCALKSLNDEVERLNSLVDEWAGDFVDIRSLVSVIRRKLDRDDLTNIPALLDEIINLC